MFGLKSSLRLISFVLILLSACSVPGLGGGSASKERQGGGMGADVFVSPASPTTTLTLLSFRRTTPTPSSTITPTTPSTQISSTTPFIPSPTFTPTRIPSPTSTSIRIFKLCSPLESNSIQELSKIISDPYRPPPIHSDDRHHGVDFSYHRWGGRGSILGVVVQAIFAGTVAAALEDTFPYGNVVIIETPGDWLPPALDEQLMLSFDQSLYILYAHMGKTPLVDRGELVSACQPIGEVGQSGNTIVAHLHVETRIGPPGATFTGMSRFIEDATPEEKANYKLWRTSGVFQHFDPMVLLLFDFEPEP